MLFGENQYLTNKSCFFNIYLPSQKIYRTHVLTIKRNTKILNV